MNEWLLWIGAGCLFAAADAGMLMCAAVLGAFARTLLVGAVIVTAGTAVYGGLRFVLSQRHPGDGRPET